MAGLEYEMTYRVEVGDALDPTDGSPTGARQFWVMKGGALDGSRIKATMAAPGGDWMRVSSDGF